MNHRYRNEEDFRIAELMHADRAQQVSRVKGYFYSATGDIQRIRRDTDDYLGYLDGPDNITGHYRDCRTGGHDIVQYLRRGIAGSAVQRLTIAIVGLRVIGELALADCLESAAEQWRRALADLQFHCPKRIPGSQKGRRAVTRDVLPQLRYELGFLEHAVAMAQPRIDELVVPS